VVAIKVLNPHGISSQSFQQQVEELRKLRHPNLVPLLGACPDPEALALVYEFLPGASSLKEEHCLLDMPWPDRTRIAAQICSALVFLHQNNMVHGDLKPANVLLHDDATAKLADYGLCQLLEPEDAGAVLLRCSATSSLAYMDPEFLASGELRPSSDVYSFGMLLLRLLTGRPAMGLVKQVQTALATERLPQIMDASVGEWPYPREHAQQLAHLGVKCCEMASANRPELAGETVTQTLGCYLISPPPPYHP
jgi:serine/threonine protein kinase